MPATTYHPRTRHSAGFYRATLTALIDGLNARMSDEEIAQLLAARGLSSATGKPWTAITVRNALYRLRHPQTRPNRLHQALLQFVFAGVLTVADTWILFQPRNHSRRVM